MSLLRCLFVSAAVVLIAGCSAGMMNAPPGGDDGQAAKAPVPEEKPEAPAATKRMVVTTAWLNVTVPDAAATRPLLVKLVADCGGYVASADDRSWSGSVETLTWVVRVPADRNQEFLDAAARLGEVTRNKVEAKDVTAEFVDASARMKNLKVEEEALNRLMGAAKEVGDVLKVREQLRQVRLDIELAEGRVKVLSNLAALSTVHLTVQSAYVKPAEPAFGTRISSTFANSVEAIYQFGKSAVVAAVAVVPWLPLVVVLLLVVRRVRRRWAAAA